MKNISLLASKKKRTPKRLGIFFSDIEASGLNYLEKTGNVEPQLFALSPNLRRNRKKWYDIKNTRIFSTCCEREYLKKIMNLESQQVQRAYIYFHNLKGYDGRFIHGILRRNTDLISQKEKKDVKREVKNGKYFTEIDDPWIQESVNKNNDFYFIKVKFKTGFVVEFRCTYWLFPNFGIKSMGASLSFDKRCKMEIAKGVEDYDEYDCSPDEFKTKMVSWTYSQQRIKYIRMDVMILYIFCLRSQQESDISPFKKRRIPLTASSNSFSEAKNYKGQAGLFNHFWLHETARDENGEKIAVLDKTGEPKKTKKGHIIYEKIPHLSIDDIINLGKLRGGFTSYLTKYTNKTLYNVMSFDITSSYPYVYSKFRVPCGKPIKHQGKFTSTHGGNLLMFFVDIKYARFKKDISKWHPFLPKLDEHVKGRYIYNHEFEYSKPIAVFAKEWVKLLEYYDMEYEIVETWEFKTTAYLQECGGIMIKKKMEIDATPENEKLPEHDIMRTEYKLGANSLFGKFGEKHIHEGKYFCYTNDDYVNFQNEDEYAKHYPPVASFITMMGRLHLIEQIENITQIGGVVLYTDTDSVKVLFKGDISRYTNFLNIGNGLGQWKIEWINGKFKMLGAKSYMVEGFNPEKGKKIREVKLKGCNNTDKDNITFDEFKYGKVLTRKRKKTLNDGIVLGLEQDYTINKTQNLVGIDE